MTRFITLTAAGVAALALAACYEPQPEETETAAAFPGADAISDDPAPAAGSAPPAGATARTDAGNMTPEEAPPPNPTPTLPPESGAPTSGAVSPPER